MAKWPIRKIYRKNIKDCDFLNEIGLKPGAVNSWINAVTRGKQSSEATEHIWTLIGLHMWIGKSLGAINFKTVYARHSHPSLFR